MHSRLRSGSGRLISFLKQNITAATLVQLAIELSVLFAVGLLAIHVQEGLAKPLMHAAAPALAFAVVIVILNGAFGIYRRHEKLSSAAYILRLCLAPAIGVPLAYLIAEALPGGGLFQQNLGVAFVCAFAGLLFIRHTIVLPLISTILPHRVMVLGTGAEASMVEASLAAAAPPGMRLVGFHPLEKEQNATVSRRKVIARTGPLEATVKQLGVNEIIVAVREQRGGVLPLRALLECRLNGVQVTDLARFFERVHGQVPIDSLKVSWLIYGDGYRQDWARQRSQAGVRRCGGAHAAGVHAADHGRDRHLDHAREWRPHHLPAGTRRSSGPGIHAAQVSEHGPRCRKGRQGVSGRPSTTRE